MITYIRRAFMSFWNIFKDHNDINEKSVVGFISFAIMVIYAIISVIASLMGYDIPINETIYNSFVTVTLGSFGIATVGQALNEYTTSRRGRYESGFRDGYADGDYRDTHEKDIFTESDESEYEIRMKDRQ